MKCLFLINPSSGTKTVQKKLDRLIGQLILKRLVSQVEVFYTQKKGDAYKKIIEVNPDSFDFFVSVGGDGTVNEVISGIVERKLKVPLAILAAGTVNDFSTHLKIPRSVERFVDMICNMKTIDVDIGKVNDHYFANVVAGGMFSDIGFQVSKGDKERFGPLAYYASGLRQLPEQLNTSLRLRVKTDQEEFEEEARLFMITNTSQVGGFKSIAPHANIQDGQVDLLIIRKCTPLDMIAIFKDYTLSAHKHNPYIRYIQAKTVTVECDKDIVYDIDGEEGNKFPIHVKVEKKALRVIIP